METIKAIFSKGAVTLPLSTKSAITLQKEGYGQIICGTYSLSPLESLYLLESKRIELRDGKTKREINFSTLLRRCKDLVPDLWIKYLIYKDLRSKGYIVKESKHANFEIFRQNDYPAGLSFLLTKIIEGEPINISRFFEMIRNARKLHKELVVAVVDRRSEIIYYSLGINKMRKY